VVKTNTAYGAVRSHLSPDSRPYERIKSARERQEEARKAKEELAKKLKEKQENKKINSEGKSIECKCVEDEHS
jgi:predicted RNase H-like nuclease (RuvC/YqgF family)